jgi:hypothetical protein
MTARWSGAPFAYGSNGRELWHWTQIGLRERTHGPNGGMADTSTATFRQRAQSALEQKAKRGELFRRVAIGYVRSGNDVPTASAISA